MKRHLRRLAIACLSIFIAVVQTHAAFVSGSFSGAITSLNDPLGRFLDAKLGDRIVGSFRYSTYLGDWAFVGVSDVYRNYQTVNPLGGIFENPRPELFDLSLFVETNTTTIPNKATGNPIWLMGIQLQDNPSTGSSRDSLAFLAYDKNILAPNPVVTEISLNFMALNGQLIEGSLPPQSIILSNADQRVGEFSFLVDTNSDGERETRSSVLFSVDSINMNVVPEPSAWIYAVIFSAFFIFCRNRFLLLAKT